MRILSGIKPTGKPHIGNYFGMMRPAIEWQDRGEAFYFIADYHALTTVHDPAKLREYSRGVALDFLACGLDPAKAVLFRQSDVPGIGQLAWILSTLTPMPMLENAHAYKATVDKQGRRRHLGLFAYPVLMAADILIYDSDIVPVGRDQKQHVEITRDLAHKMNASLATSSRSPSRASSPRCAIPGLDGQKMSKSYDNTIELFLEEKPCGKSHGHHHRFHPGRGAQGPGEFAIVELYRFSPRSRCGKNGGGSARVASATAISKSASSKRSGVF